jgi:hypothetical protein
MAIPVKVDFVQSKDMSVMQGPSLAATVRLGEQKGYRLIHVTITNAIFVDEKYYSRFGITDGTPAALWTERPLTLYI